MSDEISEVGRNEMTNQRARLARGESADPRTEVPNPQRAGDQSAAAKSPQAVSDILRRTRAMWPEIRSRLKGKLGQTEVNVWFGDVQVDSVKDGCAHLSTTTTFRADTIMQKHMDNLRETFAAVVPEITRVDIAARTSSLQPDSRPLRPQLNGTRPPAAFSTTGSSASQKTGGRQTDFAEVRALLSDRLIEGAPLDPNFTFENFVVGKANQFAYDAALRIARSRTVDRNPVYFWGPSGLGKTHLCVATAWEIRKLTPARKVIYMCAETFMLEFVRAMQTRTIVTFKEALRSVDVLIIDDVQFLGGKDSTQEEFFYTFNYLMSCGKQIILTADRSPQQLDDIQERLQSRLGAGLLLDINPMDFELRLSILQAKAERYQSDEGIAFPQDVLELIARRITKNVREMEGALTNVAEHARFHARQPTIDDTLRVLKEVLQMQPRIVEVKDILEAVAAKYGITVAALRGTRRTRDIARPRQIVCYLAKQLTTRSYPEIGRMLGGKDHTTILYAVRRIAALKDRDPIIAEDIEDLIRKLER